MERTMTDLVDLQARGAALDPASSCIVQAPAGSGKTGLLTQRYLRLLATVEAPEEIVAITFTRKAAAEMRTRILEALQLAYDEHTPPADDYPRRSWELARTVLRRDNELGWQLLQHAGRLRIMTFDAFSAALTRQMPWLSRLGAQPQVSEDADDLYRRAARDTLAMIDDGDEYGAAVRELLGHLDNNSATVEQLLMQMLSRRDQWMRPRGQLAPGILDAQVRGQLEDGLARVVAAVLQVEVTILRRALPAVLPELLCYAWSNLAADARTEYPSFETISALPGHRLDDLDAWRQVARYLLKRDGKDLRATVTRDQGFPAPSGAANPEQRQAYAAMKTAMVEGLASLADDPAAVAALRAVSRLPDPRYSDPQWVILRSLVQVLDIAPAHLKLVFREQGRVDFTEIAQAAVYALGDEEAPTDLALQLDHRIRHLLVDEFQDTSVGQERLLTLLTAGWQPGDGRTLFLVGDPMQSIYRFREAEVSLFLRARRMGRLGQVALQPLALQSNFRSNPQLLDWINTCFATVLPRPADEDLLTGAVPYLAAVAGRAEGGTGNPVQYACFVHEAAAEVREAEWIATRIQQLREQDPAQSIAILVRARSHLAEILPCLRRHGIAYLATDIDVLDTRPEVLDLYALTRALLHPADTVAWFAILRAPWCGLELADLLAIADTAVEQPVADCLQDPGVLARLSDAGRARVMRVDAALRPWLARYRRQPLARLVEGAWRALGGERIHDTGARENIERYLDYLATSEQGGDIPDLQRFHAGLERLYAGAVPVASNPVQVMTIHKAKGLEFDQVILPALGRGTAADDKQLLHWLEHPLEADDSVLLLAPIAASGDDASALLGFVRGIEKRQHEQESRRLLYVAATRARHGLSLTGCVNVRRDDYTPANGSFLGLLWDGVGEDFIAALQPADTEESAAAATAPPRQYQRLPLTACIDTSFPPALLAGEAGSGPVPVEYEWAGDTARHVGNLVHEGLARLAATAAGQRNASPDRVGSRDYWRRRLLDAGVVGAEVDGATDRVVDALHNTLHDATGRWLLDPGHASGAAELPLSAVLDGELVNVVIDRTFVDENGIRWIVDYKTAEHAGGDIAAFLDREVERHAPQLLRYARILALAEERPIRAGLYFPLLQAWREVVVGQAGG